MRETWRLLFCLPIELFPEPNGNPLGEICIVGDNVEETEHRSCRRYTAGFPLSDCCSSLQAKPLCKLLLGLTEMFAEQVDVFRGPFHTGKDRGSVGRTWAAKTPDALNIVYSH